jgi:hypothetical protein
MAESSGRRQQAAAPVSCCREPALAPPPANGHRRGTPLTTPSRCRRRPCWRTRARRAACSRSAPPPGATSPSPRPILCRRGRCRSVGTPPASAGPRQHTARPTYTLSSAAVGQKPEKPSHASAPLLASHRVNDRSRRVSWRTPTSLAAAAGQCSMKKTPRRRPGENLQAMADVETAVLLVVVLVPPLVVLTPVLLHGVRVLLLILP